MLRLERICCPHRGVCRFVVVGGVVTLATRLNLQLHRIRIEFLGIFCRQLEPTLGWFCCSLGRVRGRTLIVTRVRGRRGYFPSCSTTRRSFCKCYGNRVYLTSSVTNLNLEITTRAVGCRLFRRIDIFSKCTSSAINCYTGNCTKVC